MSNGYQQSLKNTIARTVANDTKRIDARSENMKALATKVVIEAVDLAVPETGITFIQSVCNFKRKRLQVTRRKIKFTY